MVGLAVDTGYQSPQEELINMENKLSRLREGKSPRVVDLFSGCGGMSLGLHRAGYSLLGGVEINPKAINTHTRNFFGHCDEETFAQHNMPRDIRTFTPDMFMREILHQENPANLVDMIVGGPPCQAFARVGRAKLSHVRQEPDAYLSDERASLYLPYLQYVEFFRPLAVIMENVPDIMNYGKRNVAEEIACTLDEMGYRCHYTILNTANYGVPQMRQRFYLIALLDALNIDPYFPEPTHFIEVPSGYDRARTTALSKISKKTQQTGMFDILSTHYIDPPVALETLSPAVTAYEAISDLPEILFHLNMGTGRGMIRNFETRVNYKEIEPSTYASDMRTWPGFSSRGGINDHVIRLLPRDYKIFALMEPGAEYPRAHDLAEEIFLEQLRAHECNLGQSIARESEQYKALRKQFVPPYDPKKFPNKWWKLVHDQPSRTLTAHMGKDTYSHIHYEDKQARVISVREAARLQSFPDGFEFTGPMNAAYTQVGNAVSPLQSYIFGMHVQYILKKAAKQSYRVDAATLQLPMELEENTDNVYKLPEVVGSV